MHPLEELAQIYPQLYLAVKEGNSQNILYRQIVHYGYHYQRDTLDFTLMEDDCLTLEKSSFGSVRSLYLSEREDFNRFIQIMRYRCEPVDIPPSVGAMFISGIINWRKIELFKEKYKPSDDELRHFMKEKGNYQDSIIILSRGAYANTTMEEFGVSIADLDHISYIIRKYHELTHYICRYFYSKVSRNVIWDEMVADAIGLVKAFGEYNPNLARKFLGIKKEKMGLRYVPESRLEVYMSGDVVTNEILLLIENYIIMIQDFFNAYPLNNVELEALVKDLYCINLS